MAENIQPQPAAPQMVSSIQFDRDSMNMTIHVLDIARRHGTRHEASFALSLMSNIEQSAANIAKRLSEDSKAAPSDPLANPEVPTEVPASTS